MEAGAPLPPVDPREETAMPVAKTTGTLFGVGMGPGDPDYLTVRAMRVLERAPRHFCLPHRLPLRHGSARACTR